MTSSTKIDQKSFTVVFRLVSLKIINILHKYFRKLQLTHNTKKVKKIKIQKQINQPKTPKPANAKNQRTLIKFQ